MHNPPCPAGTLAPPEPPPRPALPLVPKSDCWDPHLADQFPALVDTTRTRVAQKRGDQRAATAPPPGPGLHSGRGPAGSRAWTLAQPPTTTAQRSSARLLWGQRCPGCVSLAEGVRGRGRSPEAWELARNGSGRCVGNAWEYVDAPLAAFASRAPTHCSQPGSFNPVPPAKLQTVNAQFH